MLRTREIMTIQWRHNERHGISNHQPHDCLLNRLFKVQIKENIKAPRHRPLWGKFTADQWIPHTEHQWRGKCFHSMTSSWQPWSWWTSALTCWFFLLAYIVTVTLRLSSGFTLFAVLFGRTFLTSPLEEICYSSRLACLAWGRFFCLLLLLRLRLRFRLRLTTSSLGSRLRHTNYSSRSIHNM